MDRPGPMPGVVLMLVCLLSGVLLLSAFFGDAFGGHPDMSAAVPSAATVTLCTCVEGPAAAEIERLRREVRLLRAEKQVNGAVECAKRRRNK